MIWEEREATLPGRLPKSDVSDFGHYESPKSGRRDFGGGHPPLKKGRDEKAALAATTTTSDNPAR
jgi:hypothetical protein